MVNIPVKAKERLTAGLKRFQPILQNAKDRDINESDTVTIITDLLSDIFGYDKFNEVTSEFAIKKTFCDLAIKIDDKISLLIEIKAAGLALKDDYVRQAVDCGANVGVDFVALTNSIEWKVYQIVFAKPVEKNLLYEFNMLELNPKKQEDFRGSFLHSKVAIAKSSGSLLGELAAQKEIINHFFIGQLLVTDSIVDALRRHIRRISPDIKVTNDEIKTLLVTNVIKRDVFEGDRSEDAKKRIIDFEKSQAKNEWG